MSDEIIIRGIDDKRRLLRFFGAKDHKNLVLRIVDVTEMRNDLQLHLIKLCASVKMLTIADPLPITPKSWLLQQFPSGWIVLPLDKLLEPMELNEIAQLQNICFTYHGIRLEKGEPNRIDPCAKCGGTGRVGHKACEYCDGSGQIITFLEMSEEERELAREAVA